MMREIFRRKSLQELTAEAERNEHGLKRHLTAWNLVLLGVGCIVGAGIFVITGTAAALYAGPAFLLVLELFFLHTLDLMPFPQLLKRRSIQEETCP
ncbi:MAG TPA: hypothetical protein VJ871_05825 [Bacteroidales bacterium]|jgi:amino acid permease|nr:hypothetical protein [Bacteroidales bacterium]